MLFFGGAVVIFMAVVMLIKFFIASGRPKADLPVKEYVFQKIKTDIIGLGGNQKHAKVMINVNGVEHEALVLVGKAVNVPVGENIKVSYSESNPKDARYYNPKKELLMVVVMFIIGGAVCTVSMMLSDWISR